MWIILWDPFLMKLLVKKDVCRSRQKCTSPKKNQKKQNVVADADAGRRSSIQTHTKDVFVWRWNRINEKL